MARTITAAVGRLGASNRVFDTRTIQELLNKVPPGLAGPLPKLDVDGLCGPKTINAIQGFQQRQFSWADGRVDPNGKTLARLNDFDRDDLPIRLLRTMTIRRVGRSFGFVDPLRTQEWYFEVRDPTLPNLSAVYFFGRPGAHRAFLTPINFQGASQTFESHRQLFDLESVSSGYLTDYGFKDPDDDPAEGPQPDEARSRFTLSYLEGNIFQRINIAALDHLQPPRANRFPGFDEIAGLNVQLKTGAFQLVRS